MKLSDAIALGRTLLAHRPGTLNGCAQGMALLACGMAEEIRHPWTGEGIKGPWPWVIKPLPVAPCGHVLGLPCGGGSYDPDFRGCIAHLFDDHVFGAKDWTLDQLIDWVRSVEPQEEEQDAKEVLAKAIERQKERIEESYLEMRADLHRGED